jgi:hypothetical protein
VIRDLYIIDVGICIYSYSFKPSTELNEQLLSGLLSAIGAFAQETFNAGLQAMEIRNGQKLAFYFEPTQKLTFCAICDARDNNHLMERLLGQIAHKFIIDFNLILSSEKRPKVDEYKRFDPTLQSLVKFKAKARNGKSMTFGFLIGIILLTVGAAVINNATVWMRENMEYSIMLYIFLFMICCYFSVVSLSAGYVAGNTKMGLLNGIIFFITENGILAIFNYTLFVASLYISPFVLIAMLATGYLGGYICDRRNLYPL